MNPLRSNRIILARHGETFFNRDSRIMGQFDSPLTPEGLAVAGQVGRLLDGEAIAAVYSSPLGRALASAKIYTQSLGLPITPTEAMAELSFGSWEGLLRVVVKPEPGPLRASWDERPPGGESYRDAEARVGAFIKRIEELPETGTIFIVGHAGVNRVFLRLWVGLEPGYAVRLLCPHDTLFILEGDNRVLTRSLTRGDSRDLPLAPE
ncbi:MAG: histidine phosphatase family protein [Desulfomonile tiedjei]|nr:histidine phosphatase family protein [Desulfomonile tiedjei]